MEQEEKREETKVEEKEFYKSVYGLTIPSFDKPDCSNAESSIESNVECSVERKWSSKRLDLN